MVTAAVLLLTPLQLTGAISAPLTGRIGPRLGWRRIVVTGAIANFTIFALATVVRHHEWFLVAAPAALGMTYGGFMLTGLDGLAVTTAPKDWPGSLSGLNGACFGIGASLGIALASAVITAGSDANGVTEAGYRNAMLVALALLAVGVVTALLIRRPERRAGRGSGTSRAWSSPDRCSATTDVITVVTTEDAARAPWASPVRPTPRASWDRDPSILVP